MLRPLSQEAWEMNKRQLDPTEIVKIPCDAHRLGLFVLGVCFFAVVLAGQTTPATITSLLQRVLFTGLVMLVSGASPYHNLLHSMLAALYLATLSSWDPPVFAQTSWWTLQDGINPIFPPYGATRCAQTELAAIVSQSTIAATIPLQILRLYDRGWQVQRWPLPILLGSTYGWAIGVFFGTWFLTLNRPPVKSK
jgi:hypothetical protein